MSSIRPRIAFACLAIVLAGSSVFAEDHWVRVHSANFTLIGNASEKEIRQVATKLEQFRYTFSLILPNVRLTSAVPTNVVVFKSDSSYRPFKPKRPDGKPDDGLAGYFQPGDDVNYITLSTAGEKEDTYGTIFHEYVHAILNSALGESEIPPWFNEGLAEYYQTFRIENDQKVFLGDLQEGHLYLLQNTNLIPLKQFFAVSNYSLHANGDHSRSIFYAEAWALIHYLIQSEHGANQGKLGKFLARVMNNEDAEKAFTETFGMDYAAMEKALTKYVSQRSFAGTTVTFKQKIVFDDRMTAEPIGEAESNAYLGDLLYHTREYTDAETYLNRALALSPNLSMAHTSLGLLKMRLRNYPEARKQLEMAILDDQKSYFAQYCYAFVLGRGSTDEFGFARAFPADDLKKMRAALDASVALNPSYPASYYLRAWIELISGTDLETGQTALRKAIGLQPGRDEYKLLLAQYYLKKEQFEPARLVVDRLAKASSSDQIRQQAAQIKTQIDSYLEAKQAVIEAEKKATTIDGRKPIFIKREAISDAEVAKLERDREIRNINIALGGAVEGEQRAVGRIESIECANDEVLYSLKTDSGPMLLKSKDFQSLRLQILREGTNDLAVGCTADISGELLVADFEPLPAGPPALGDRRKKPAAPKPVGILHAITFVPRDFRLMTAAEIRNAPTVIIQGAPPTDTAANARLAEEEQAKLATRRREMLLQQINAGLRKPLDGEVRMIGTIDRVECSGRSIFVQIGGSSPLRLRSPEPKDLVLTVFRPDTGGLSFGCGVRLPGLNAVITYRQSDEKKEKMAGDLVAVEFVPDGFRLPEAGN